MRGGHGLHPQRPGAGQERARGRADVQESDQEVSGPQVDSTGHVEIPSPPQEGQ